MAILVDQAKYNTLNAGNSTTEPLENGVFSKQIIALVLNNSIKDNCDEVNEAGITLDDTIQQEREAFHTIISRAGYKPATVDNQVSQSVITLISNTSTALTGNTRQMANPVSLQSGDFFNIFIDTENTQPVRITYGTIATEIPLFIKKSGTWQDSEAGTLKNGYYTIACVEGYANINSSNKTFILVSGGGGGGLSTSYNGAVVNGASSVITLTNADTDIETYAVLKQGVKITITPDVTATANAVVTLANSNLTNTKIFCKDIDLNTYSQVGALQELKEGIPFEVTYIDNQTGVNGGSPFLLANDLSGQGFLIEIEDFQQYTASTTTNTITLTQVQGIQDASYKDLQIARFKADAVPTAPTFAKFPNLTSKEIVNKIDKSSLLAGVIQANEIYTIQFNSTIDKWEISNSTQMATQLEYFNKNSTKSLNALNVFNDVRNERYTVGNSIAGLNITVPTGNPAVGGNGYNVLSSLLEANETQHGNIAILYKNIANATQNTYLDETNNKFLFPSNLYTYNNSNAIFTICVTVIVDIGSTSNATTKFYIRLLRFVDNTIVSSKSFNQSDFVAQTGVVITTEFKTFVNSEADPFVVGGMYIDILNDTNSSDAVTVTSIDTRIFRD